MNLDCTIESVKRRNGFVCLDLALLSIILEGIDLVIEGHVADSVVTKSRHMIPGTALSAEAGWL